MRYEFQNPKTGATVTVACDMADAAGLSEEMQAKGFYRVWGNLQINHQLEYNDAYDESVQELANMKAKARRDGAEAQMELGEIIKKYG